MFLFCFQAIVRGEDARGLELSDLFASAILPVGSGHEQLLIGATIRDGKTNANGNTLFSFVTRHCSPFICAVNAIGFHLFHKFHISTGEEINFTSRRFWYRVKLFHNFKSELDKELTYVAHKDSIEACFSALNLNYSKKTHIGRGSGATMAANAGASVEDIKTCGHWNNSVVANVYLNGVKPKESITGLAGLFLF